MPPNPNYPTTAETAWRSDTGRPPLAAINVPATATVPLLLRHVTPGDTALVAQLLATVAPATYYARFFTTRSAGAQETGQLAAQICGRTAPHIALLATVGGPGRETAIALAECVQIEQAAPVGEIALLVHDSYQALGIGSVLFDLLVEDAIRWPFALLQGIVLGENRRLLQGLRRLDLKYTTTLLGGSVRIDISLGQNRPTEQI